MPVGDSVLGSQLLVDAVPPGKRTFLILIQRPALRPPSRIGYYWVEAYIDGAPERGYLLAHGPLYVPGVRVLLPFFGLLPSDLQRMWVDWNEAGLTFEIIVADGP